MCWIKIVYFKEVAATCAYDVVSGFTQISKELSDCRGETVHFVWYRSRKGPAVAEKRDLLAGSARDFNDCALPAGLFGRRERKAWTAWFWPLREASDPSLVCQGPAQRAQL